MQTFSGDFETHLTVRLPGGAGDDEALRDWAERTGLKYTRIVLDRGQTPDQPMLTARGRGTLPRQREAAHDWVTRLRRDGFEVTRVKIEAAPWNESVPQTTSEAVRLAGCYFEHHVKLTLADDRAVESVRALVEPHAAHVSRNARRSLADGRHERFVTQRCWNVGRPEARQRLDDLRTALTGAGFTPVEVEEEFVVYDDNSAVDAGWITPVAPIDRRARGGEPYFADRDQAARWRTARRTALDHVLGLIAASSWRDRLVLRGSMVLPAWLGEQAREPGDLDWVLIDEEADVDELCAELLALVRQRPEAAGGVVLDVDAATRKEEMTEVLYELITMDRLVIPWRGDGLPPGAVQMDFARNESVVTAMVETPIPRGDGGPPTVVNTASRELSLAWKVLWLNYGDTWEVARGKDLYDAVLLAEDGRTRLAPEFLEDLDADMPIGESFDVACVQTWDVEWEDFQAEYPWVPGTADDWQDRLTTALTRMFGST